MLRNRSHESFPSPCTDLLCDLEQVAQANTLGALSDLGFFDCCLFACVSKQSSFQV